MELRNLNADVSRSRCSRYPAFDSARFRNKLSSPTRTCFSSFTTEGVIPASGTTTHNLRAFGQSAFDATPPDSVKQFDDWLEIAIAQNNTDALLDYRRQALRHSKSSQRRTFAAFICGAGAGGEAVQTTQLHTSLTACSAWQYAFR